MIVIAGNRQNWKTQFADGTARARDCRLAGRRGVEQISGYQNELRAVFLCLLAGFWRGVGSLPPWLASAGAAMLVHAATSGGPWPILAGAVAGGGVAAWRGHQDGSARHAD